MGILFGKIGLFCTKIALVCIKIGQVYRKIWLFCAKMGRFVREIGLCYRAIGLFCGNLLGKFDKSSFAFVLHLGIGIEQQTVQRLNYLP